VEQHLSNAALVAARQEAEREAEEAKKAKRDIEAANAALREEMAIRLRAQSRLAYLATHDPLTALANRTLFSDRFSCDIEDARRRGHKLALLYVDLDNFKDVNDTLGHAACCCSRSRPGSRANSAPAKRQRAWGAMSSRCCSANPLTPPKRGQESSV